MSFTLCNITSSCSLILKEKIRCSITSVSLIECLLRLTCITILTNRALHFKVFTISKSFCLLQPTPSSIPLEDREELMASCLELIQFSKDLKRLLGLLGVPFIEGKVNAGAVCAKMVILTFVLGEVYCHIQGDIRYQIKKHIKCNKNT